MKSAILADKPSKVLSKNKHLKGVEQDYLYHLGLTKDDAPQYAKVQYVCTGGSNARMTNFANKISNVLDIPAAAIGKDQRYVLYLVGPVLVCSHGMGGPSTSILLHEVAKLLQYANADAMWLRIGSCGGLRLKPGTIVITSQSLNGAL